MIFTFESFQAIGIFRKKLCIQFDFPGLRTDTYLGTRSYLLCKRIPTETRLPSSSDFIQCNQKISLKPRTLFAHT